MNLFDICESRHRGSETSIAANARVAPHKDAMRRRLLEMIRSAAMGLTSAEIESELGIAKNRFSGRLSELKASGMIYETTATRGGCKVLVAK